VDIPITIGPADLPGEGVLQPTARIPP